MNRREFITLAGAAGAWPVVARAQQREKLPVIGFLGDTSADLLEGRISAFRKGLQETGAVLGRNYSMDYRWAAGQLDRSPVLAAELIRNQPALIVANGSIPVKALKSATATIPILFVVGTDPIESGIVTSLSRHGGNVTGVSSLNNLVTPKRLELLHELLPSATVFAHFVNPRNRISADPQAKDVEAAAQSLGLKVIAQQVSSEDDFDRVFQSLAETRVAGLVISSDGLYISKSRQLAALSVRYAIPTVFHYREFAEAGGIMSYGSSQEDSYRQIGIYAGRILQGENPVDLPVQQSTKVELIINLGTAKQLGLTMPITLLGRADEVIE